MPFVLVPLAAFAIKVVAGTYAAHKVKHYLDAKKAEETERMNQERIQEQIHLGVQFELAKREVTRLIRAEQDTEQDV